MSLLARSPAFWADARETRPAADSSGAHVRRRIASIQAGQRRPHVADKLTLCQTITDQVRIDGQGRVKVCLRIRTMKLIVNQWERYHVSQDTVVDLERAMLSDHRVQEVRQANMANRMLATSVYYTWRALYQAGHRANHRAVPDTPVVAPDGHDEDYFVVLMGFGRVARKCMPYFMSLARKSIYLFDAWPQTHEKIEAFVNYWAVGHVFLSSSQAAERLSKSDSRCQFHWIPEGVSPDQYRWHPHGKKDIDVLHLGTGHRRYDAYHERIALSLDNNHRVYAYGEGNEGIVFPSREEFVDGLARSKISICVPATMTNPERCGGMETMTSRYLQSMVSKCLVVGHAPEEMTRLFGYNPAIEIDMTDPVGQLEDILDNYSDYVPLVERNYEAVVRDHTWKRRWSGIARILFH